MLSSLSRGHREQPGDGVAIRQPSSAQLLIDSLDRYPNGFPIAGGTTSSAWQLNLQQLAMNGYIHRLAVSQIQFQWNLPTIITDYNDQLYFNYGGSFYTATLAPGFYTPDDLAAEIQTAMNTAIVGVAFTVVFSPLTGTFTWDSTGSAFVFLNTGSRPTRYNRAYLTLGIYVAGTAVNVKTGTQPSMLATRYIDICSNFLTKYQRLKDTTTLPANIVSSCIARIYPVALNTQVQLTGTSSVGSQPFIVAIDFGTPKQIAWSPEEAIGNFDLQLLDEDGQQVPWTPTFGCEYNIVLLASET